MYRTVMIIDVFISFSAVQTYDLLYVTFFGKTDTNAFPFIWRNLLQSVYTRLNGSCKHLLNSLLIRSRNVNCRTTVFYFSSNLISWSYRCYRKGVIIVSLDKWQKNIHLYKRIAMRANEAIHSNRDSAIDLVQNRERFQLKVGFDTEPYKFSEIEF